MAETFEQWADRMGYRLTPFQSNLGQRCLNAWADGGTVDLLLSRRHGMATLRSALRAYMNGDGMNVVPLGDQP